MICINQKQNPKLLQTFNNDPFFDLVINTATTQLNLVLGYLSIDSEFFEKVVPDTRQVNLEHLAEGPTIKVLRALYGEELQASSVKELGELFSIIEFLQVSEYTQNIIESIRGQKSLMDSLELLEFCFQHGLLVEEMKQHHYSSDLAVFSSSKNYLQLSKVSQETLNDLLLGFSQLTDPHFANPIVNSILEFYFCRNQIRATDYFTKPDLEPLQLIWEKYHHSINYLFPAQEKIRQSQIISSPNMTTAFGSPKSIPNAPYEESMRRSEVSGGLSLGSISVSSQLIEKNKKILSLEKTLELKNEIIKALENEIAEAKGQEGAGDTELDLSGEGLQETKRGAMNEYDVSLMEPAFDQEHRKLEEAREVKTMNKLNGRSRKIFD